MYIYMKFSDIKLPSEEKFGKLISALFLVLGFYFFIYNNYTLAVFFIFISLIFLLIVFLKPQYLRPLNITWMYLGYILNIIISPIVLGSIFYLIISPISILTRIFKRDELNLLFSKKETYWKDRPYKKFKKSDFENQF